MQKKVISKQEYQKKVEMAHDFIRYFEYKDFDEANRQARAEVAQEYVVKD